MVAQFEPINSNRVDSTAIATDMHYHRNCYESHHQFLHQQHQQHQQYQQYQQYQQQQQQQQHSVPQPPEPSLQQLGHYGFSSSASCWPNMRKRKAESQDNERLSKRLSLLNLEKSGRKCFAPVENTSPSLEPPGHPHPTRSQSSPATSAATAAATVAISATPDDTMHLDDTKHKVYIYDIDAELASADENSDSESSPTSGHGRVVFLPDVEKHFYRPRIPPAVLANNEGELAGHKIDDMQMVLYSEPCSISVSREHDSVRKAILEARARARQKQKETLEGMEPEHMSISTHPAAALHGFNPTSNVNMVANAFGSGIGTDTESNGLAAYDDVDAMDMD